MTAFSIPRDEHRRRLATATGMRHCLLSIVLLAAGSSPAQAAPVADRPQVLLDTVGPDGWRVRLGPTNFGSMLESEPARPLWQTRIYPLMEMWQQLIGGEAAFAESKARMLGYGGRIRVAMWFDPAGRRRDPAVGIAAVLEPDGRSDLEAIAADLRKTLYEALPGEWVKVNHEDFAGTVRRSAAMTVVAPILENGSLLIAASRDDDLARAMQRVRALAAAATDPLKPNSPAGRLVIDFPVLVQAAMATATEDSRARMQASGLGALGTATLSVSTAGPRVQFEYEQKFTSDERGLFAALMPSTPTTPTLLAARPESGSWVAGHLDLLKAYENLLQSIAATGQKTVAEVRADNKRDAGIDLDTDLFDHMTDEAMLWVRGEMPSSLLSRSWVYIARLRDEAAFAAGLFKMLPQLDPLLRHAHTETHDGIEIHCYDRYVWLAVGRGVFVLAYGDDAEENLVAALDRCRDLPDKPPAEPELLNEFASLKRHLPPGYHGCSQLDAILALSIPGDILGILAFFPAVPGLHQLPLDLNLGRIERDKLTTLLSEHDLETVRAATGYADRTWRWRTFW